MIVTSLLKWRNFRDSFQFNKNTTHSALCEVMNAVMRPLSKRDLMWMLGITLPYTAQTLSFFSLSLLWNNSVPYW